MNNNTFDAHVGISKGIGALKKEIHIYLHKYVNHVAHGQHVGFQLNI